MEIKGGASDEIDFGGRREREAATKDTKKRTKLKKAHYTNREVSGTDQHQSLKSLDFGLHVHGGRHRLIPEDARVSRRDTLRINSDS
jgi:hypothetical protein